MPRLKQKQKTKADCHKQWRQAICVKAAYFLIERKLRATLAVTLHKFPTYETKELGHFGESCLSRTSYVIFWCTFCDLPSGIFSSQWIKVKRTNLLLSLKCPSLIFSKICQFFVHLATLEGRHFCRRRENLIVNIYQECDINEVSAVVVAFVVIIVVVIVVAVNGLCSSPRHKEKHFVQKMSP